MVTVELRDYRGDIAAMEAKSNAKDFPSHEFMEELRQAIGIAAAVAGKQTTSTLTITIRK